MPVISFNRQRPDNIPLSLDFGHSPVGTFWKGVKPVPPKARLSLEQRHARTSSLMRAMHVLTPRGLFACSKHRAALERTSLAVSNLIGALSARSDGSVDGVAAQFILRGLPDMMKPLCSEFVLPDAVLTARLEVNFRNMTPVQLGALIKGLGSCSISGELMTVVRNAAVSALQRRTLADCGLQIRRMCEGPNPDSLDKLMKVAARILSDYDQTSEPAKHLELVWGTLGVMLVHEPGQPRFSERDAARVIRQMPVRRVVDLIMERSESPERVLVNDLSLRTLPSMLEVSAWEFDAISQKLTASAALDKTSDAAKHYADHVIKAAQLFTDCKLACDTLNMQMPDAIKRDCLAIRDHVAATLSPGPESAADRFDEPTLRQLRDALDSLGMPANANVATAELCGRKEAEFAASIRDAATSLAAPNISHALRILGKAKTIASEIGELGRSLEVLKRGIDGGELTLSGNLIRIALMKMPENERSALRARMETQDLQLARAALGELGNALPGASEKLVMDLREARDNLSLFTRIVRELPGQKVEPDLAFDPKTKNSAVRDMLKLEFGILLSPEGEVTVNKPWSETAHRTYRLPVHHSELSRGDALIDLLDFSITEHSPENPLFLEGCRLFNEAPTIDKALYLANRFIGPAAQSQANLGDATCQQFKHALTLSRDDPQTLRIFVTLLAAAREEVSRLVWTDTGRRFLNAATAGTLPSENVEKRKAMLADLASNLSP